VLEAYLSLTAHAGDKASRKGAKSKELETFPFIYNCNLKIDLIIFYQI